MTQPPTLPDFPSLLSWSTTIITMANPPYSPSRLCSAAHHPATSVVVVTHHHQTYVTTAFPTRQGKNIKKN